MFADGEVAIVTGSRAEKLHALGVSPGRGGTPETDRERKLDHVVHQGQARIAAYQDFRRRHVQHLCEQLPGLQQALQTAIVAHVRAVLCAVITGENAIQRGRQRQLLSAWLASREIQCQRALSQRLVGLFK